MKEEYSTLKSQNRSAKKSQKGGSDHYIRIYYEKIIPKEENTNIVDKASQDLREDVAIQKSLSTAGICLVVSHFIFYLI